MHIAAICTFGQILHLQWNGNAHSRWPLVISMSAWLMHLIISSGTLQLNRARCRLFVLVMYVMVGLWVQGLHASPGNCQNALILSSVTISVRFAVATFFVNFQIGVPAQSLLSLLETWNDWQRDPASVHISCLHQLTVLAFILVLAGLMEFHNRSRNALLANSESMVLSFRRVLRGVCDGEVVLDSKLRVSGEAGCLQTLLMTTDPGFYENFEDLLAEDERERFRSFIMSEHSNAPGLSAPPCLRVSLKRPPRKSSTGSVSELPPIGVDLFHVPHMLDEETYHLIALREDSDSRSLLEVVGADEDVTPAHTASSDRRSLRTPRSVNQTDGSVSQVSSNSVLQICREVKEMTLLVDATTPLLDVDQAHLSFARRSDSDDSSMPSLRRLIQPTDWGTVHDRLVNFAQSARSQDNLQMKLRLQDDSKRRLVARHVQVSAFRLPGDDTPSGTCSKLCIQLQKFKFLKASSSKQTSRFKSVSECSSEDSDLS
ncbi:unnamed protein product [Symbiodinium natans]|uniref:Uncharacterized protein n=1 Tax=Symbiodinium natans TaxID=878477 RepID=A0A812QQB6_9DINO|nr:unnamed protein product [Symbiodinium natans]